MFSFFSWIGANPSLRPYIRTCNCTSFQFLLHFLLSHAFRAAAKRTCLFLRCCFTWMLDRTAWVYLKRTGEFRETVADKFVRKKCRRYGEKIVEVQFLLPLPRGPFAERGKAPFLLLAAAGESPAKRWRECLGGLTRKSRAVIPPSCRKKVFRSGPQGLGTPTGCISSCARTSSRTRPFSGGEMTLNCANSIFFRERLVTFVNFM